VSKRINPYLVPSTMTRFLRHGKQIWVSINTDNLLASRLTRYSSIAQSCSKKCVSTTDRFSSVGTRNGSDVEMRVRNQKK
jgi:hypothetical protein